MTMSAYSVKLFFPDGHPDEQPEGLRHAEVENWDGYILFVPRPRFSVIMREYPEAKHRGIYILLGEDNNAKKAYIGKSKNIGKRIKQHIKDKDKEWFSSVVLLTKIGNRLSISHVEYLEPLLIKKAKDASRIKLDNGNTPLLPSISDIDKSAAEEFAKHVYRVLPSMRIDLFVPQTRTASIGKPIARFTLASERLGLFAKMRIDQDGKHVVEKGSIARGGWVGKPQYHKNYQNLRKQLFDDGILKPKNGKAIFTADYPFNGPSVATIIIYGRSGVKNEWKVERTNKTYGEWEAEQAKRLDSTD